MHYKLIHLITGLNTGGAEMMLYKLVSQIDRERFDIKVISLTDVGPVGEKILGLEIPVIGLGMKRGVPNPFFLFKLAKNVSRIIIGPDFLLTQTFILSFPETVTFVYSSTKVGFTPSMLFSLLLQHCACSYHST